MPERPVRWAVVGSSAFALGSVVPALRSLPEAELCAVVSRDPTATKRAIADDSVVVTTRLSDLPAAGVELVHLVVPNQLHLPMTLECLSLGLNVLVEKPMAVSMSDAHTMALAAQHSARLLAVGSCMAWSPVVTHATALMHDGAVGRIFHAEISAGFDTGANRGWRQTSPTEAGGGVLFDLGAHAVDALVRLFGPIRRVSAALDTQLPQHASDDSATLTFQHETGVSSHAHVALTHGCNELSITGERGRLTSREWLGRQFRGDLRIETLADASKFDTHPRAAEVGLDHAEVTDVVALQAREVSQAVRGNYSPAHADLQTALHVTAVLEAAIRSSTTGRAGAPEPTERGDETRPSDRYISPPQ
jgi:predicted dehydrogenase